MDLAALQLFQPHHYSHHTAVKSGPALDYKRYITLTHSTHKPWGANPRASTGKAVKHTISMYIHEGSHPTPWSGHMFVVVTFATGLCKSKNENTPMYTCHHKQQQATAGQHQQQQWSAQPCEYSPCTAACMGDIRAYPPLSLSLKTRIKSRKQQSTTLYVATNPRKSSLPTNQHPVSSCLPRI